MIAFWLVAAVMLLAAVALVAIPLARRSSSSPRGAAQANIEIYRHRAAELEAEHGRGLIGDEALQQARRELERALLLDAAGPAEGGTLRPRGARALIVVAAVVVPLLSLGLYLWLGNAGTMVVIDPGARAGESGEASKMHGVEEMVARLEQRLQRAPADAEGWILLVRSYAYLRRFDVAASAYAKALPLKPGDARLLADYAEALAVIQDSRVEGEALRLARRALGLDPLNHKALWLSGLERFQKGDHAQAAALWTRLRQQLPPGSGELALVDRYIAQARDARTPPAQRAAAGRPDLSGRITVRVSLDASLAHRAAPDDAVFIYARAHNGPRMPLAIVRRQVRDLPAEVVLDDSQAMTPGLSISRHAQVVAGARISRSGDAMPRPGDLEGLSAPLRVGLDPVAQVRIDRVVAR